MAQFSRPDGDHDVGSWDDSVGNNDSILFNDIDEDVTATDGNEIRSGNNPDDDTTDDVIFTLATLTDPVSSTGHTIRVMWRKSSNAGRQIESWARLYQGDPNSGGTLIATINNGLLPNTDTPNSHALDGTETDNITDYSDLYIRFSAQWGGSGAGRRLHIEAFELEVPDAPAFTPVGVLEFVVP